MASSHGIPPGVRRAPGGSRATPPPLCPPPVPAARTAAKSGRGTPTPPAPRAAATPCHHPPTRQTERRGSTAPTRPSSRPDLRGCVMPKPPTSEGLRIGKLRPKNKNGKQAKICPACCMPYSTHGAGGNCAPHRERTVENVQSTMQRMDNAKGKALTTAAFRDGIVRLG